ncbi:MAG: fumarylacetoacetate (FAA) hydrolase family protein [halophilic archaeon J07HX5]|nr:MAG: fumarylacetoacetate (FAA) hydrolase family protein [halophilic archaeon J07HX5]
MQYFSLDAEHPATLLARDDDGTTVDLTAAGGFNSFRALAQAAADDGRSIDDLARNALGSSPDAVVDAGVDIDPPSAAGRPVIPDEVWAAGVTYQISEQAREAETGMPALYLDVYDADRPELFFKATPERTVGPGDDVGVRDDSAWDVPEPELAVVLCEGAIVGYTVGNDLSSRAVEGENALYLPQAKIYDRSCAIGPCVVSPETVTDPHDLTISMTIKRAGETVYEGTTSTAEMVRSCEELVSWYTRHNHVPELSVLLTGTSLVPPDSFTLHPGDHIRIDIEAIGTLENGVVAV